MSQWMDRKERAIWKSIEFIVPSIAVFRMLSSLFSVLSASRPSLFDSADTIPNFVDCSACDIEFLVFSVA